MKALLARLPALPPAAVLSNGLHSTLIHGDGGGFSRACGLALNDWNADPLETRGGVQMQLRDLDRGDLCVMGADSYLSQDHVHTTSLVGLHRATRDFEGLGCVIETCVGSSSLEARRMTLDNPDKTARHIEVTVWMEVALAHPAAHAAHPAFSKLFVQTEFDENLQALVARRRPRANNENSPCMINALIGEGDLEFETDRMRLLGRGRLGQALSDAPLSGSVGNVLDPVFALRRRMRVPAQSRVALHWLLTASESQDQAMAQWKTWRDFDALAESAASDERKRREALQLSDEDAVQLQALIAAMYYGLPALGASKQERSGAAGGFGNVWGCGMPTDRPFTLVMPGDEVLMRQAITAQRYWRSLGLEPAMLVLTNGSDVLPADEAVSLGLVQRAKSMLPESDLKALLAVARWVVNPSLPSVEATPHRLASASVTRQSEHAHEPLPCEERLLLDNSYGGFSADGKEYVIRIRGMKDGLSLPPLPWVNVLANERFGCLISETGAGCTWARNSRERRLTPWSNDPVRDPHDEAVYIVDLTSGTAWSPMPGPAPSGADHEVRHGWGRTVFHHRCYELSQATTVFVHRSAPVKFVRLSITNHAKHPRELAIIHYARLVLGFAPAETGRLVSVDVDQSEHLLTARNRMGGEFAGGIAFASVIDSGTAWSALTSRTAFFGRNGHLSNPAALWDFSDSGSDDRDPCFAQRVRIQLDAGASATVTFVMGECATEDAVRELLTELRPDGAVEAALQDVTSFWERTVTRIQVSSPSPAIDLMVNGWLTYQNLSSRIWARTAFYQCSGAFGFRDQLQDAGALVYLRPDLTRKQILLHAAQQFVEGDVTHWWHEAPIARGLRTRFSDDLNWLPYITAFYVRSTGDAALLDESAPFLKARLLEPGEDEAYLAPELSGESGSVYEHCCRALDRSLTKGAHGLPLMGTGDWNDGMNRVGREGRGESVWMGFFLYEIIEDFLPLCDQRGDAVRVKSYSAYRDHLRTALNDTGWDGEWYRRAYYDDGTPLGSKKNDECRIDALAQAWAVISGAAPAERAAQAMDAVEQHLISERDGIIQLLAPSFVNTLHDPGYIKGYVAGVRENGGQYTHAACWVVKALAELGQTERAARLLEMLSPVSHASSKDKADVFKLEPYAVAADVYGEPPHAGRGGWSWYTGSAGWVYRVAIESVFGLQLVHGSSLRLKPCMPAEWPGFAMTVQLGEGRGKLSIEVMNTHRSPRITRAEMDDAPLLIDQGSAVIPLPQDASDHRVFIWI
jgi:cellobiose phosphorylase